MTESNFSYDWREAFKSWKESYGDKESSNAPATATANTIDLSQVKAITREDFERLEKENPKAVMDFFVNGGRISSEQEKKVTLPDVTKESMTREQFELLEKESPLEAMNFCLRGGTLK